MPVSFDGKLVVAISSRALFDLSDSHQVFEQQGLDAFQDYQVAHEDDVLAPGDAFALVKKLLAINEMEEGRGRVEVILLSRNSSDTGLRVFNSIEHYGLPITRAAFAGGESPHRYVPAFGAHVFLSTHAEDVRRALDAGFAAATILSRGSLDPTDSVLRIAFDGDAVLFSDESEQVFQSDGLEAFAANEKSAARQPLSDGPFRGFLEALHQIQREFTPDRCPIRTALVTARSAPAHERVVRTLRSWGIRIDESLFLGGLPKGEFLRAFGADVFFDDQQGHCESASRHVAAGHVPHGISNPRRESGQ
ncbi:MAG: 5'-nucleotidase [Alcanivorax sp.]|uniref:5'-nucleotidase n=1 Tax=Alloalcanivorax marinus TaxID=1177169 RepID=A0A9Q3ULU4_9GAMM|nr:5'-nucleotidase [Alloalcanivorax marinus]MBM7334486.1 5'-nucleotidase [Alloalcanivorax marinus]MCC4309591.1 5'-nucleotidase [Alloalcanivorax marinus]MCH2557493.1 5'-nucleotidase [Alcanivorax sp.]MCU5785666.1 5'-nucleotidase [Alloalcanivorax marinus]